MIQAAALKRVVDLAGAVGGDDDDRRLFGLYSSQFRNGDLKIRQHFEQECFERFVCPVEFVDQENRRSTRLAGQGLQNGTADQVLFRKDVLLNRASIFQASRLIHTDFDHLCGIIPLIDG